MKPGQQQPGQQKIEYNNKNRIQQQQKRKTTYARHTQLDRWGVARARSLNTLADRSARANWVNQLDRLMKIPTGSARRP